jgi:hypothetical protein
MYVWKKWVQKTDALQSVQENFKYVSQKRLQKEWIRFLI